MGENRNTEGQVWREAKEGVGLRKNKELSVVVQEGERKWEFSGWVGMGKKEELVGWSTILMFWPKRT